ncbi:hypothetical protein I5907_12205 [Panacibacter sp. DH6]|uniref:PQQ-like beta-propeller repeat protein n=1 Tax=Panacibacter microcysteis TaxID=2793269 RepID=A0A931E4P2_9BACT|nr:hypothetical protein [Panacibacter microcysteis]MBG9376998.1 hypothetical protein [Panacibacter microcysteis]
MKQILALLLIAGVTASAQPYTIDTLPGASAFISSFALAPFTGVASNGNTYITGFIEHTDQHGNAADLELVRIETQTKKAEYKTIRGFSGGKGYYWNHTYDKEGNIYLSMLYPRRKMLKLNLRDSIYYEDLGSPFINNNALTYALSAGNNQRLYFGSSSGGTYWSEYDLQQKQFIKHHLIDSNNDYVLSITGDKDYAYAQTGQRRSVNLWAINKQTEEKKLLFSIPNNTRFDLNAFENGVYVGINTDTLKGLFKLEKGQPFAVKENKGGKSIATLFAPQINPNFSRYYDPSSSRVYFSFDNKKYDYVTVKNAAIQTGIKKLFAFPNDADNIYYAGDYYGNYYRYNLKEKRAYLLGSTGYNIYSSAALNDSMIYLSGYPSGFIMLWNKNRPWTTQTTINGKHVNAQDANANPRILHFWKSEGTPAAGFHHTFQMVKDNNGNLVGAGDVIRIGNAASIGVYNAAAGKIYGIDYTPFTGFNFAGIATWKELVVYSMKTKFKRLPKLYFYHPGLNKMTDSIDLGFRNYGLIFIQKNVLTGIADNHIYSVDLTTKKLLWNYEIAGNISGAKLLHNGRFVVCTSATLPAALTNFTALPVASYLEANNQLYAISGRHIVRIHFK